MRETEAWQPSQPVNSVKVRASNGGFYALNYRSFVIRHFPLPSELSVGRWTLSVGRLLELLSLNHQLLAIRITRGVQAQE